jgi:5-methylcytosine-specific restriction endonuclease McrA
MTLGLSYPGFCGTDSVLRSPRFDDIRSVSTNRGLDGTNPVLRNPGYRESLAFRRKLGRTLGGMAVSRTRKARSARKRKRRMERVDHDLSVAQWVALCEEWGGCAYCGATDRSLQKDCVLPLSRGGRYTLDNIAPACGSCNASKSNQEVTGWMRRRRLDERAFLLQHREIAIRLSERFSTEPDGPMTTST